jgi:hypothetical protein
MSVCAPAAPEKALNCKKEKLCGNSCISANDVCHKWAWGRCSAPAWERIVA